MGWITIALLSWSAVSVACVCLFWKHLVHPRDNDDCCSDDETDC